MNKQINKENTSATLWNVLLWKHEQTDEQVDEQVREQDNEQVDEHVR